MIAIITKNVTMPIIVVHGSNKIPKKNDKITPAPAPIKLNVESPAKIKAKPMTNNKTARTAVAPKKAASVVEIKKVTVSLQKPVTLP